jgi:diguanylate cyclase (GGDEF)-like protein
MKILLVEDDLISASVLSRLLVESYYSTDTVTNAQEAWEHINTYKYDLVILDVILPDTDGIELCTKLRHAGNTIPILLLTAKDSPGDRLNGWRSGADDYVVKPYNFEELIARIKAILRRYSDRNLPIQELKWGDIRLDLRTNIVTYKQNPVRLTHKEYGLLEIFLRYPQQIFSRSVLLDRVWSVGEFPSEEVVTTHIKGLRQKLKSAGLSQNPIETLYGTGYRLKLPPNQELSGSEPPLIENAASQSSEPVNTQAPIEFASLNKALQSILINAIALFKKVMLSVVAGNLEPEIRYQGYMEAHRLIGSLGVLGFNEGAMIAHQIELLLNRDLSLSDLDRLGKLVDDLQASSSGEPLTNNISASVPQILPHISNLPLLLIVDNDPEFTSHLQSEAEILAMRVQIAADIPTAKAKINQETPNVILLDLLLSNSVENALDLLNELTRSQPKIPIIMMATASDLKDRVMVAKNGGSAFIEKPISAEEVVNITTQVLLKQHNGDRSKVMIVDDDPISLQVLAIMLRKWEIEVTTLQDPQKFWQVLEATSPDLLILDLIMPEYDGLDLCRAVRTDPLWQDLPIVFLSAHSDRATTRQLFAAGADDYLSKPIVAADLQTHILSRLERSRNSRQISEFDGLTGLYTHRRGIQNLTLFLRLAKRNQQNFCLTIIDLDFFKKINDCYGHRMGDKVLKQFGSLLRQHFRNEDVTIRWGGEEFVVGLYGANRQQGIERLTKFLKIWQQQEFLTDEGESFSMTFSAGVAEYPQNGTNIESLYHSMDIALYQAKAAGRNKVVAI